jgi:hypothetical protein
MIGWPSSFPCCGPCFKLTVVPTIKEQMARTIRVSTRLKREAIARRKAGNRKVTVPKVAFYDYVPEAS